MKPPDRPAMTRGTERTIIALIILTTALGPFTMNVPLPSMPTIAGALDSSYDRVQLILTLYLLALAVGQIVYGPLSDRFGRRPVLLAGLAVYVIGSLASAAATSVGLLLAARFVQGVGGCAGLVLGRAMLADLYGRNRAASLIAYVTMAMVAAPMIAPALGGLMEELFSWRAAFASVGIIGVVLLAATAILLPETHGERAAGPGASSLLWGSRRLLAAPDFLVVASLAAFSSAMYFAFLAGAPHVVIELMGRSPAEFGLWFAGPAALYMLGNFLSGHYATRLGTAPLIRYGTLLALLGAAILVGGTLYAPFGPATIFLPMAIIALGNGLVLPNAIATAVTARPDLSGAASGLTGALQMGLGAAATIIVAAFLRDSTAPMVVVMTACGVIAAIFYLASKRYRQDSREAS